MNDQQTATIYDIIGGAPAVDRLVETFYRNMDAMAPAQDIRAMHATDLGPTKAILKLYLSEWLGGPGTTRTRAAIRACACAMRVFPSARRSATPGCCA